MEREDSLGTFQQAICYRRLAYYRNRKKRNEETEMHEIGC